MQSNWQHFHFAPLITFQKKSKNFKKRSKFFKKKAFPRAIPLVHWKLSIAYLFMQESIPKTLLSSEAKISDLRKIAFFEKNENLF